MCLFYQRLAFGFVNKLKGAAASSTNRFALSVLHDGINVNHLCLSGFGRSLAGLICSNVFVDWKGILGVIRKSFLVLICLKTLKSTDRYRICTCLWTHFFSVFHDLQFTVT